jgi:Icc-related predicted phosphoesterase
MKRHLILFSSDLHGNSVQYRKLVAHAVSVGADSLVIGGDIAPKPARFETLIGDQRRFFEHELPRLLEPLKRARPTCRIFLMMGNDDADTNSDVLRRFDPTFYSIMQGMRFSLNGDFDLVGYGCVPITPFAIKDWEKFDFTSAPARYARAYAQRKETNYQRAGWISDGEGWRAFAFDDETEARESIQMDLAQDGFTKNSRRTVYAVHTPPDGTNLDVTKRGKHVGSLALRAFIEEQQPLLTLHGHIHETVDMTGHFTDRIGDTLCVASGNDNRGPSPAAIVVDLYDLDRVARVII